MKAVCGRPLNTFGALAAEEPAKLKVGAAGIAGGPLNTLLSAEVVLAAAAPSLNDFVGSTVLAPKLNVGVPPVDALLELTTEPNSPLKLVLSFDAL